MNKPQFKIFGNRRRAMKKELANLKYTIKYWWFDEPIQEASQQTKDNLKKLEREAQSLEELLKIPY